MTQTLKTSFQEIISDIVQLLPVAAFIFISSVPADALAFTTRVEAAHQPLVFIRDSRLASTAIVGIEAFPSARTAGITTSSRASAIPDAASHIYEGMKVRVLATAYSSQPSQTDASPFMTAAGTRVTPGTVAANFLPFKTKVRIDGSIYTVLDRMNRRYNGKYIIDIWRPSQVEALQFGVRMVEIEIVSLP